MDFDRLRQEWLSANILVALDTVTNRNVESCEDFVRRSGSNPISRAVKLADLRDNSDLSRIAEPAARDMEHLDK